MIDNIKIIDNSGDKRYFTIIPNYILNHSSAIAQALYLQLKRLAGEDGVAYPGQKYLTKQLGISKNTLKKELKYLVEKKWIYSSGYEYVKTDGGIQKVKSYKIVDLWGLNNNHYQRGVKIEHKEEPYKEEHITEASSVEWNSDKYIEKLLTDNKKHVIIIGNYFKEKGYTFPDKETAQKELRRWVKDASIVSKYDEKYQTQVFDYVVNKFPDMWNLSTMAKFIGQEVIWN